MNEQMTLSVCGLVKESIVDGPGLRYVVFVQGCPHLCEGCHNPQSHDFNGGSRLSVATIYDEIKRNPLLSGVTFSGGEPFCQPAPLCWLADKVHALGKNVITYTGFTYEDLLKNHAHRELLKRTDILIDGKFVNGLKDYRLKFKGSSNQRTLYLRKDDVMAIAQ